jgi:opacity protein-like surface antigen
MKRLLLSAVVATFALAAPLAAHAQTTVRFSVAGGASPAVGDLGRASDVGMSLAFRGETVRGREWGFRGDLTWDRFGSTGVVDAYEYFGLAGNLMHRDNTPWYEFGGLGFYNQKVAFRETRNDADNLNLGMQFGVGYNFKSPRTFLELGIANVFTSGSNSVWFPLKFGVRF